MTYKENQILEHFPVVYLVLFILPLCVIGYENVSYISTNQNGEIRVTHYLPEESIDDGIFENMEDIIPARSSIIKDVGKIIGFIVGAVILFIIICIVCCCCCPFCLLAKREERGIVLKQGPITFLP